MNIQNISSLKGHSGCKLLLEKQNEIFVVTKISKNHSYNDRLKKQIEKQIQYKSHTILTPKIISQKINSDHLFEVNMEYIHGLTLAQYMNAVNLYEISEIENKITQIVPKNLTNDPNAQEFFLKKINELSKNKIINQHYCFQKTIQKLESFSWNKIERSTCHGDLTFENILIHNNQLYLIDFLDSFYDSWMIDIAKIFQDTICCWSFRNDALTENTKIRLICLQKKIENRILILPDGQRMLKTLFHILLIHLLRIVPYTEDEKTMKFIKKSILKVESLI